MRQRRVVFLLSFFLFILASFYKVNGQASGRWSGTVTEHSQVTGVPSIQAESMVTINYNNNVGTGTYSKNDILTIDGKIMGRTNCTGTGTIGFSELSIDNANKTYTIQTSALIYTCTYLRDSPDSGECYITIDNEPWDENPRVLKGSKLQVNDVAGGKLTTTTTWNLVKESDVELIVTPQKYDTWLPIPGRDEQTPGSEMMTVTLELTDRNGGPASEKASSFELILSNTSKEKGITINMPLAPAAQQLPDLRFQPQQGAVITQEGQLMTIFCPSGCVTTSFKIACFDGGAWTTLTAKAVLETDTIKGNLLVSGGDEEILIPKRDPASKIATYWLNNNGNPGESDDEDEINGVPNKGDGLSAYEEYRGVICEKEFGAANPAKFGRLDPRIMNLGIRVDKAELPYFTQGISWFENATKLKVLRFYETEIGPDRKLNKNAGHANIFPQYTLLLYKGLLSHTGGALGVAFTTTFHPVTRLMQPDIPANTQNIVIDPGAVQSEYNDYLNRERPAGLPFTQSDLLANVIAHELCHGVNIPHHGQHPDEASPQVATLPDQSPYYTFRVFERNGNAIPLPTTLKGRIGISGGLESGDLSCVMAYNPYYNWAHTRGADLARIYNKVPLIPIGNKLCTSAQGTGFNHSIIYFGDASSGGNCFKKIKLK